MHLTDEKGQTGWAGCTAGGVEGDIKKRPGKPEMEGEYEYRYQNMGQGWKNGDYRKM